MKKLTLRLLLVVLLLLGVIPSMVGSSRVFQSLPEIESFRQSVGQQQNTNSSGGNTSLTITRVNNVDVIQSNADPSPEGGGTEDIVIVHIVELMFHSFMAGGQRIANPLTLGLQLSAAIQLALEHLNARNGTIIEQVGTEINDKCENMQFTHEIIDTAGQPNQATDNVVSVLQRSTTSEDGSQQLPTAFLGGIRSAVSIATSLLTTLKGYPQFSTVSLAKELDNKEYYGLFGRFVSNEYSTPILQFMTTELDLTHLAVLHRDNSQGISMLQNFRDVAAKSFPGFEIQGVAFSEGQDNRTAIVSALMQTKFHYVFTDAGLNEFEAILVESQEQGAKFQWILGSRIITTELTKRQFLTNDPLLDMLKGIIAFDTSVLSESRIMMKFQQVFSQLPNNPLDLEYLQEKLPKYPNDFGYRPLYTAETFAPGPFAAAPALAYDMTIAVGLAACAATTTAEGGAYNLDGATLYKAVLNTTFQGASGEVLLNPITGSQEPTSSVFAFVNVNPVSVGEGGSNTNVTFEETRTHIYRDGNWTQVANLIFNDGTVDTASSVNVPSDLPAITQERNYVGTTLRAIGWTLSAIVVLSSLGLGIWTFRCSNLHILKASQPIFLYLICLGTGFMGASILPFSLDDEIVSDKVADVSCTFVPWLVSLGWCCSFSALFTKTNRINKIFHNPNKFKRVTVQARDVMQTMGILLLLNVIILTSWTIVSPLLYERNITSIDQFNREIESEGHCSCDQFWGFAAPLIIINLGALCYALQQAYVAREISTEFSESEWIFRAMSFIGIVSFLGVPVLVIANDNPRASYFVFSALVFCICGSLLGFIFVPKILQRHKGRSRSSRSNNYWKNGKTSNDGRSSIHSEQSFESSDQLVAEDGCIILRHPTLIREELERLRKRNAFLEKERKSNEGIIVEGPSTRSTG